MKNISSTALLALCTLQIWAQCPQPTGHIEVALTPTTYTFGVDYEDCGGQIRFYQSGSTVPLGMLNAPPGYQELTLVSLQPVTSYDVFVENICIAPGEMDCTMPEISFSYVFTFMTPALGCNPPTGVNVVSITPDSIRYQVNMGMEGGKVELKRGSTLITERNLGPGTVQTTFGGLNAETTYTACFFNSCGTMFSSPNCRSATTASVCTDPSGFVASELTPISFVGSWNAGQFGGRAWLYLDDQSFVEFLVAPGFGSFNTSDQLTLTPDKQYIICLFNACDEFRTEYSDELCVLVRTPSENCLPPDSLTFSQITSNSFVMQTELGPFGGTASIRAPGYEKLIQFEADDTEKTVAFVPSNTEFQVELRNNCFDGSQTDPITGTVRTLSATESNGFLTAPTFINESDVWVSEDLRIMINLPDPNSDGWAKAVEPPMSYVVQLVEDCMVTFEVELMPESYPSMYRIPRGIPLDPYEIHIMRKAASTAKDGEQISTGTVIVGPPRDAGPTSISTDYRDIKRWVLHVPKKAGGFQGWITFLNKFPTLPSTLWVAGFDTSGAYINGTARPLQIIGLRAELPIYSDSPQSQSLFTPEFTDQISHIGLLEQGNKQNLQISVIYQQINDPNALTASLPEANFDKGSELGTLFTMEARQSANFWDGAAVLNLGSEQPAQVLALLEHLQTLAPDQLVHHRVQGLVLGVCEQVVGEGP